MGKRWLSRIQRSPRHASGIARRCQAHETIELNLDGVALLDARAVATAPCVTTLSPHSMAGRRMIVRKEPDGSLILIAQTNHAELSGFFAANWGNEMFARPRPHQSVVLAAIYHDAGWYKYEAQPVYDVATRSTPNFVQVPPDAIQLEAYQWAIDWVSGIDPYAGLLVNRHRTGLWAERYHTVSNPPPPPRRPLSDLVKKFMTHNEAKQEHALQSLDRNAVRDQLSHVAGLGSAVALPLRRQTRSADVRARPHRLRWSRRARHSCIGDADRREQTVDRIPIPSMSARSAFAMPTSNSWATSPARRHSSTPTMPPCRSRNISSSFDRSIRADCSSG